MKYPLLLLAVVFFTFSRAYGEEGLILTANSQHAAETEDDSFLPLLIPAIIAGRNHTSEPWPDWPAAGNPSGTCAVPSEAQAEDTSTPDHIIGDGRPESCTSDAVVSTIAKGGIIRFNCGPEPIIIQLNETAKIVNTTGPTIVIDGGGKVALSGNNLHRILYMNTCDQNQVWTTSHCQNQDHPQLTVQNLVFLQGNSSNEEIYDGGGAIWARGGRLKIVNCRFFNNICAATGPDLGGAAVRAFSQYENLPLYVVNSTFGGGTGFGNSCSNGGGLSSIGVSYSVINSLFSHNSAIGYGANPQRSGTPGGGSGGAIYNDGNTFDLKLCGTRIENNSAREGGGAIFFVSNDRTGHLIIEHSFLQNNPSDNFENYPGIFYLGDGEPQISNATVQ
jgi:predicted outer membrane repeat protein